MPPVLKLRDEGIAWKEVDGEILLLDVATSTYLSVNQSAALLWQQLHAGTTREELVRALAETYELDDQTAADDVDAFLADCRDRGLLVDADE